MAIDKNSSEAEKMANLYRSAYYFAVGVTSLGFDFLKKSGITFPGLKVKTKKDRLYWAEKILDKYHVLKIHMN